MNRIELLRKYIEETSVINLIEVQKNCDENGNEFIRIVPSDVLTEIPEIKEKLDKLPYNYHLILRDSFYTRNNDIGYTHVFDLYLMEERYIGQKLISIANRLKGENIGLGALFD